MRAVVVLLAACGRFGFDARIAGDARTGDGGVDVIATPKVQVAGATVGDPGDQLGYAVALSGDGSTLAVGAPGEDSASTDPADNSLTDAGAVYVFVRSPTGWMQQAYVKAPLSVIQTHFGQAVALSRDGTTLAVGAPASGGSTNEGQVFVFVRSGATWTIQGQLVPAVREAGDEVGYAVALSASGNTLLFGAPGEDSAATGIDGNAADNSATDSGAAYVFTRSGASWSQQAYLKASNTDASDAFGQAVALSDDGASAFVAAPSEASLTKVQTDNSGPAAGAVYAFANSGAWTQTAYLKEITPDSGAFFGFSIATSGDGTTLAIGAPGNDTTVANSGALYHASIAATASTVDQQLKAGNAGNNDQLGLAAAVTAPGTAILGGASLHDDGATDCGAAYRFDAAGMTYSQSASFEQAPPAAGVHYGAALATSSDGTTIAIGIPDDGAGKIEIHYLGQ